MSIKKIRAASNRIRSLVKLRAKSPFKVPDHGVQLALSKVADIADMLANECELLKSSKED